MENTENRSQEWYARRIAHLSQFVTDERAVVLRSALDMRTNYMTIMAENTFHPQNASALVRHCEAFGVQNIHTVETLCKFNPNVNIVKGTDKWIDIRRHHSTSEALRALKSDGYRIVATTPHRESCTPETFDVKRGKFALVLGTEHAGISDEVLASADEYLRIPMCGMVESLNVSASAAILIYILSQRMREQVADWQLGDDDRAAVMFRWLCESVKDSRQILERFDDEVING